MNRSCALWQEAISASIDNEPSSLDAQLIEDHLKTCPECTAFQRAATSFRTRASVYEAVATPEIATTTVRAAIRENRAATSLLVRILLAGFSMVIIGLAAKPLLLGEAHRTDLHDARHIGAFSAAYGVGAFLVAFRPARARTFLPVSLFVGVALILTSAVDLASGEIPLSGEIHHLNEIVCLVLIWILSNPRHPSSKGNSNPQDHQLRVIDPTENH